DFHSFRASPRDMKAPRKLSHFILRLLIEMYWNLVLLSDLDHRAVFSNLFGSDFGHTQRGPAQVRNFRLSVRAEFSRIGQLSVILLYDPLQFLLEVFDRQLLIKRHVI